MRRGRNARGREGESAATVQYFDIQRKIVAAKTGEGWRNVPHVSYVFEPEVTAFLARVEEINRGRTKDTRLTLNTALLCAIVDALKAAPRMNSHLHFRERFLYGRLETFRSIHISLPLILPNGKMMTVNLRNMESRTPEDMARYVRDIQARAGETQLDELLYQTGVKNTLAVLGKGHLAEAAGKLLGAGLGPCRVKGLRGRENRDYYAIPATRRLTCEDIDGGTITVSNIGSLDRALSGCMPLLEIIPPQVCAISLGPVQERPVVVRPEGTGEPRVAVGKVLPVGVVFDHRALDFGDVAPFVLRLQKLLRDPAPLFSGM